jgi:diaminohydroxyphosphoribosylaminopyrimidine deaminase/5-amino-6-(5-phosphoribosylamino)uracil reductase
VVDSRLRIRSSAKILSQQRQAKTLVVTTAAAPGARRHAIAREGIEVLVMPAAKGRVSLRALLNELGRRGITSLMVEGGGELNAAFLKGRLVNAVRLYLAPRLLGGTESKGVVGGPSPLRLTQAWKLRNVRTRTLGPDIVVEGNM